MPSEKARPRSLPARRKSANALFQGLCYGATALGLSALCLILGSLMYNGIGGLSLRVFTEHPAVDAFQISSPVPAPLVEMHE